VEGSTVHTAATGGATQSDQETGTSTSTYVSPGVMKYFAGVLKAFWDIDQNTGTAVLQTSYGVSSVTDGAAGQYTINLSTAMSSINFATTLGGSVNTAGNEMFVILNTVPTTTTIPVRTADISGANNDYLGSYGMVAGDV
jgi:hypothetical protein